MVKRWERVLEQVAEDVERPIGGIELLEKKRRGGWKRAGEERRERRKQRKGKRERVMLRRWPEKEEEIRTGGPW